MPFTSLPLVFKAPAEHQCRDQWLPHNASLVNLNQHHGEIGFGMSWFRELQ